MDFLVLASFPAAPGKLEALKAAFDAGLQQTREREGCLGLTV